MKLFKRGERQVETVVITPPANDEQMVYVVKDDVSTASEESSIFAADPSPITSSKRPMTDFVSASPQDVGRAHSRMDVHGCLGTTCKFCASSNGISFIPRESCDVKKLQKTMWAICGAEQAAAIPTNVCSKPKDKHFRCTCGQEACGRFYEI